MDLHPERFGLRPLLDDLRAVFQPLTSEKGLTFGAGPPADDVPAELFTDRQRLRQILHNLLSNAVKFTEEGLVELRITAAPPANGAAGPVLAFSVTDTGIGISDQNLDAIFGAFQQADGTTSRRYGGTGLGLTICRELAAQLGGSISVQSVVGQGSAFTLHLPLSYPAEQEAVADGPGGDAVAAGPVPQASAMATRAATGPIPAGAVAAEPVAAGHDSLRGRKVLIVDDDLRNVFAITSILELYGLTVVHASDGRTGIDMLQSDPGIDIVLMDVMMPEMDGYATTAAIRQIPGLAQLPVIAVTARAMQGDRDKSIAAGATDYVTKPVDTEDLLTVMEVWLGTD
jgi:CheY-like chemotaxis protein